MELKNKYQYTYFIYPYVVDENKYEEYILKLLKNKKCELKIFQKEKVVWWYMRSGEILNSNIETENSGVEDIM